MEKLDITNQDQKELVTLMQNNTWLSDLPGYFILLREIEKTFIYTPEQLFELKKYLNETRH